MRSRFAEAAGRRAGRWGRESGRGTSGVESGPRAETVRYWDRIAAVWAGGRPAPVWRRHSDSVNERILARWLPPGSLARVLKTDLFDEAVSGGMAPFLADRARDVVYADVSPAVGQAARRRHAGIHAVSSDVRSLAFANGSFDAIVSLSTLDHFGCESEILASLCELARALRAGGRLVLTMDNPANPAVWLRNALPQRWLFRAGLVPYRMGVTCGRRRLTRLLRTAGFEVEATTAILHCPRILAVAMANAADRSESEPGRDRLLRVLASFEALEKWPTRFLTGYYVAVLARKLPPAPPEEPR